MQDSKLKDNLIDKNPLLAGILFIHMLASADFLSKYLFSLTVIFSRFLDPQEVKRRPLSTRQGSKFSLIPALTCVLLGLIWVQTVCKSYQQMTKVITSKERVKHVHTDWVVYIKASPENKKKNTPNNESDLDIAFTHSDQSWILEPFGELALIFLYNFHRKQFAKISYRKVIAEIPDDPKISRK